MLVWTQSIPGIKEEPLAWLHHFLETDRRARIVVGLLPFVFLVGFILSRPLYVEPVSVAAILAFLLMTVFSKSLTIVINDFTFDLDNAAFLASLLVIGPLWAVINAFVGILYYEWCMSKTLFQKEKLGMNIFNMENDILSCGSAAILYGFFFRSATQPFANYVYAFLLLCFSGALMFLVNNFLVSLYYAVLDQVKLLDVYKRNGLSYGEAMLISLVNLMFVTLTPLGFLLGNLYLLSPFLILLLLPLLAAMYYLPKCVFKIKNETGIALESLGDLLEGRDEKTEGRTLRVSNFARTIAEEMGLKPEEIEVCVRAARIGDIGKIAVRDDVLKKNGSLSKEEYRHVQDHVRIIPDLFPHMEHLGKLLRVVMLHHERYDGSGYPFGLKDQEIPLEARVVAVADAWEAMTSPRDYRDSFPEGTALQTLLDGAGIQWDPWVVQALMKAYQKGTICRAKEKAA